MSDKCPVHIELELEKELEITNNQTTNQIKKEMSHCDAIMRISDVEIEKEIELEKIILPPIYYNKK